jgi:hypothetical protein
LYNKPSMAGDQKQNEGEQAGGWYKADPGASQPVNPLNQPSTAQPSAPADDGSVEWTASEFVAHEKGAGWFLLLAVAAVVIGALLYLITRDVFSAGIVPAMAVILGVAGARKPRVVSYRVDQSGLTVGKRYFPYREYKSFAVPDDGPFASVVLVPMKRFGFPVSAYLAPDSEEKVVEVLAEHLPMERDKLDLVEKLMRQLRF